MALLHVNVFHLFPSEKKIPFFFNLLHLILEASFLPFTRPSHIRLASLLPRVPVSGLVNCTCVGTLNFLPAQLGHRMETGSLEAAEKWTEELQAVSLPCLMCLQVPLKTGKAREMQEDSKHQNPTRPSFCNSRGIVRECGDTRDVCTKHILLGAPSSSSFQWFLRFFFFSQINVCWVSGVEVR